MERMIRLHKVKKSEYIFLLVLVIFGASLFSQMDELYSMSFEPIKMTTYSQIILGLMLTGIVLVWLEQRKNDRASAAAVAENKEAALEMSEEEKVEFGENLKKLGSMHLYLLAVTFLIFLFYCTMFEIIGYFSTGFITLFVYMNVLFYAQNGMIRLKNVIYILLISVITTGCLYLIFGVLFQLWLPSGFLI